MPSAVCLYLLVWILLSLLMVCGCVQDNLPHNPSEKDLNKAQVSSWSGSCPGDAACSGLPQLHPAFSMYTAGVTSHACPYVKMFKSACNTRERKTGRAHGPSTVDVGMMLAAYRGPHTTPSQAHTYVRCTLQRFHTNHALTPVSLWSLCMIRPCRTSRLPAWMHVPLSTQQRYPR
jgi:hypothetical protein